MSNIYGAETQVLGGGGFGGWGGGFDGFGRGRGHGHEGNCCKPTCCADCHDVLEIMEKLGDIDKDIFSAANGIEKSINGVDKSVANYAFGLEKSIAAGNSALTYQLGQLGYQNALSTKDIIHNTDNKFCILDKDIAAMKCSLERQIADCCCETNRNIDSKFAALEMSELKEQLRKEREDNTAYRTANIVAASMRANTVGSNFNTGTQTSSVSNNSGQMVGA